MPRDCYDIATVDNELVETFTNPSIDANINVVGDGTSIRKDI